MSYHLEIEFKNLLSKDDFYTLCTMFKITTEDFVMQKNYYFDFDDILEEKKMALRIRLRDGSKVITLKQKAVQSQHAQVEITEDFTSSISNLMRDPLANLPKQILNHLSMEQVTLPKLENIGKVETLRKEIDYQGGVLCLDYSRFNDTYSDYELEYEYNSNSINDGETIFDNFLVQNNIPRKPSRTKIARLKEHALKHGLND
ncbi:MAG: CYTH domain-containing protein [Culicoidibacterales bacterium]